MTLIHKSGARVADTYDFVLSSEIPDRMGDIVSIEGLDTKSFEANPVALYMHNHQEPIGAWSNLRKSAGVMIGTLTLASKGTSRLVDFARSMLQQGMLKAVSVSFISKEATPIKGGRGMRIEKSELVEVSLVTVPANPNALMIAKSMGFSDGEITDLFNVDKLVLDAELEKLAQQKSLRHEAALKRARWAIIQAKRASRTHFGD